MRTFEHPTGGLRETVSGYSSLLAFLFGTFYFMAKGVWRHVIVQIVLIVVLYALFGEPATMFVAVMWILYAILAQGIIASNYLRNGWIEVGSAVYQRRAELAANSSALADDMRLCPFCAEPIKKAAVKCKHCGSAL